MRNFSLRRSRTGLLALLSLIYMQTSCLEAEEKPVNFGPEVPVSEIMKKMAEPMGKMDHSQIGKNEKSEVTEVIFATNNPDDRYVYGIQTKEVTAKQELSDRFRYTLKVTTTYWENKEPKTKEEMKYEDFPKFAELDYEDHNVNLAAYSLSNTLKLSVALQGSETPAKVTFHDLEAVDKDGWDLPAKVKNKTNCTTPATCTLNVRIITVVAVKWVPGKPEKHNLTFVVSGQTPFHSKILAQCDTSNLQTEKGPLLATSCSNITDFDAGTAWLASEVAENP